MNGESLWPRLAGLPLVIEACEYERLHAVLAYEFERITTHVRLVGAGADGLGEDVSVFREAGTALHETRPSTSRCARPAARCTTCSGWSRSRCASSTRSASARSLRSSRCAGGSPARA